MFALYVALTLTSAAGAAAGAWLNFVRHRIPLAAAEQVQVPQSWTVPLGALLGLGALGLLAGFIVPLLGVAAAAGLVLYFVGAIIAHLRVRDLHLGRAMAFLALVAATLAVTVAYRIA